MKQDDRPSLSQMWLCVYPLLIPFLTTNIYSLLLAGIETALRNANLHQGGRIVWEVVAQNVTIGSYILALPVLVYLYKMDQDKGYQTFAARVISIRNVILIIILSSFLSIALNNLLILSNLGELFGGHQAAMDNLYNRQLIIDLIGYGVVTAVVEELLFRGIIYGRINSIIGRKQSIILTSLIFGFYHGNLVQGIYAFSLSLVMILVMEKTKSILAPILFHMIVNSVAVIIEDSSFIATVFEETLSFNIITFATSVISIIIISVLVRNIAVKHQDNK